MKMSDNHYKRLESAIAKVLETNPTYYQDIKRLGNEISSMCARWNLWNMASDSDQYALAREIYEYCNDEHIDTALRKITGII